MEEAFVLGMIASEGSFSVHSVKSSNYRYDVQILPQFGLVMYEGEVVRALRDEVGIGTVTEVDGTNGRTRYDWRIKKNSSMEKFIDWMDENITEDFKVTDKYDSYTRWKPIVLNKREKLKTKDGVKELIRESRKVNGDTSKRDPKYSTEELINVVDEQ